MGTKKIMDFVETELTELEILHGEIISHTRQGSSIVIVFKSGCKYKLGLPILTHNTVVEDSIVSEKPDEYGRIPCRVMFVSNSPDMVEMLERYGYEKRFGDGNSQPNCLAIAPKKKWYWTVAKSSNRDSVIKYL